MLVNDNTKIYVGNTAVNKVYQGTNVIYEELPYIPVNYLQSNPGGDQYIKTNQVVNGVDIKFQQATSVSVDTSVFGARNSGGGSQRFGLTQYQSKWHFMPPGTNMTAKDLNVHTLTMGEKFNRVVTFDDKTYTNTASYSTYPALLFRENVGGNMGGYLGQSMRIYYVKLYKDQDLVLDLIPVIEKATNEPCMYDKISKTFFKNSGSGTFLYG